MINKSITILEKLKNLIKKPSDLLISNSLVAYDKDWQFPAITEQHAYHMIRKMGIHNKNFVYIAFPWATLIDLLNNKSEGSDVLLDILTQIKEEISEKENLITVCQHIHMLKYQSLFAELGVTHIFWAHATRNQGNFPKYNEMKIYPFPLYPVQAIEKHNTNAEKEYLYSFVGASSDKWYLTQSRNFIIDILSDDNRGYVQARDTWHYKRIVYDHQIQKEIDSKIDLIDKNASQEFQNVMSKSVFSLCPSGSGPNSIRLWESIALGSIPVILADTYLPPGNLKLWDEAVIYCEESKEAICALPDKLALIAKDPEVLAKKRHAMHQLWMIYGPDCFVYDIKKLLLSI